MIGREGILWDLERCDACAWVSGVDEVRRVEGERGGGYG